MPGKKINTVQIRVYMKNRKDGHNQETAAAKAGFSERSARNVEKRGFKEARTERTWKTRVDPFKDIWDAELVPLLEKNPNLQARTLLEDLQIRYSEKYPDSLLRTLQRRVQKWKAINGPSKDVIFRQDHPPGWQGLSDFTSGNNLKVTINNEPFEHILYHYKLAFSGWKHVEVILGGESFTALAESFQNALWLCGGGPETHRTDSLSAAYKNLPNKQKEDFQDQYQSFCDHYNIEPTRNNKGESHENGSIESSHRHFKTRLEQALVLRNSRNFNTLDEYRSFIRELVNRDNYRIRKEYQEELKCLQPLPERKTTDYTIVRERVKTTSTICVKSVIYSVPSRLIGQTMKIHVYDDRLACFIGIIHVLDLPRQRKNKKAIRRIDYKHLIDEIIRKPGAFKNYVFHDDFFPTESFRQLWAQLQRRHNTREASKEYLRILKIASRADQESIVDKFLEIELKNEKVISSEMISALFKKSEDKVPALSIETGSLNSYSEFTQGVNV